MSIQSGDGTPQPTNLGLSLAELEALGEQQQQTTEEPTPPVEEPTPVEEPPKAPEEPKEDPIKAPEEPVEVDEVTPEAFFSEVNKLHGFELEVEYPEGVDPLSPEGVHIRDKAIMDKAQKDFDSYLKTSDPRAYAYLLHRQGGGDDTSFFSTPTSVLPDYDAFKESVDLQKQVLTADLVSRGLDEDIAKSAVEKAVADKRLFELSNKAYQAKQTSEQEALENVTKAAAEKQAAEQKAVESTISAITDVVMNSKLDAIVIPDAKRAEFAEYVKQHLYYDGERFFLTKPIDKDTLASALQTEYFGFVKGNLKELVERKAKTQVTARFKLGAQKTKDSAKAGAGAQNQGFIPLGDL